MANACEEIQKEVVVRFNADTALSTAANLYFNRPPKDEPYPLVVFYLTSNLNRMTGGFHETIQIQFNVYSKTPSSLECSDILQYLVEEFDATKLTITGFNTTAIRFTTKQLFAQNHDNLEYWQGVLIGTFTITDQT